MREYTVRDLYTTVKGDVPVKHIVRNIYLVQNHIVDWHFPKDGSSPKKVYIVLKGKHLARLV